MKVRCIEAGRGPEGSVFVCSTPVGDIVLKARKIAPNKYDIYSEYPRGKYKTVMYASSRFILRRQIEDWLEYLLTKESLK